MKRNYNNPYGAFVSMTGENYPNSSFANQTGPADGNCCCCTCFWNSKFAANSATSLGTIGAALAGLSNKKKTNSGNTGAGEGGTGENTGSGGTPPPPKKSTTMYWVVGTLLVVGIAGTVAFAMHRKSA